MPAIRSAPKTARELAYENYLRTPWWRARRNAALRASGFCCQRCACRRNLQVHHRSYERLGAEADDDLEVLCRGCHEGNHFNETQDGIGVYARVVSSVLAEGRYQDIADILEEAKRRCVTLKIPFHPSRFHAAAARLIPRFPFTPPAQDAPLYKTAAPHEPIGRAEAAGILARLGVACVIKHMPEVRPLTPRERDKRGALVIVAQAILDQVRRCEEAEQPEVKPDAEVER